MTPQNASHDAPWTGTWVTDRLGTMMSTSNSSTQIELSTLVGLALRRNPRRAHLLVSTVLGKHVPTDPRIVLAAGTLLGLCVGDALTGTTAVADTAHATNLAGCLVDALAGLPGAAETLVLCVDSLHEVVVPYPAEDRSGTVVLGYAETATALGHCVGAALGVYSLHSTRRATGIAAAAGFSEEHSHATEHLLLPEDPERLTSARTVVLVDDEISTGTTALNTIRALHADSAHDRYIVATLVDLRSPADRDNFAMLAADLDTRIDVVALATGTITLPNGLAARAQELVNEEAARLAGSASGTPTGEPSSTTMSGLTNSGPVAPVVQARGTVTRRAAWGPGVREGGRHGFGPGDEQALRERTHTLASTLAPELHGARVLVLGFEELMYAPLLLATALTAELPDTVDVRFSTTTRSPVLAVDDPGYALRTTLSFPAHDDPADGPGPRFAHNVAPGADPERRFTDIVVVVDAPADTVMCAAPDGLLDVLARVSDRVHLVVVPVLVPAQISTDRTDRTAPNLLEPTS